MGRARLRLVRWELLDPRPAEEASQKPIDRAVNIPFAELPDRAHELPPRGAVVRVAGPVPLASAVVAWLEQNARRGEVVERFTYGSAEPTSEIGRLWEPNAFLAEMLPKLKGGAALDLACGTGRDAVYMAAHGWEVTGLDVLPDALVRGRELAERYAGALGSIRWVAHDLEAEWPVFSERFDLITVFRYLHRPLAVKLGQWLRPGGGVLCEAFTTLHRERYGKPSRDAHVLQPGELPRLFEGFELRHASEDWRGRAHTARVWAIWPGVN